MTRRFLPLSLLVIALLAGALTKHHRDAARAARAELLLIANDLDGLARQRSVVTQADRATWLMLRAAAWRRAHEGAPGSDLLRDLTPVLRRLADQRPADTLAQSAPPAHLADRARSLRAR